MSSSLNASLFSGVAQGVAQAGAAADAREAARPELEARRKLATTRQQTAELALQAQQNLAPLQQTTAELKVDMLEQQLKQQQSTTLKTQTFDAFRNYQADGDTRHLNNFLSAAKQMPNNPYGDYVRIDDLDSVDTHTVDQLLQKAGIEEPASVREDVKGNFVVATDAAGGQSLIQMDKLYAGTGYSQVMNREALAQQQVQAQITNLLTGPRSAETTLIRDIAKDQNVSLADAVGIYNESKKTTSATSALERIAKQVKESNPGMSDEDAILRAKELTTSRTAPEREASLLAEKEGIPFDEALNVVNTRKERSTSRKQLDELSDARVKLDEVTGGSFFDADLTDPSTRRKAGPIITEIEKLSGKELSNEDKRLARNIRDLTALGAKAGSNLTEDEVGLMDRMLRQVKSYVSSEVDDGTAGVAAYESFRNIFRNSLYGASLTATEVKAFDSAMGTLGQQAGPVLAKLNESMRSMRNQMQAIYDLNDEQVAFYYLGRGLDELDQAIESIDERIELVSNNLEGQDVLTAEPEIVEDAPPVRDVDLDAIFGAQ